MVDAEDHYHRGETFVKARPTIFRTLSGAATGSLLALYSAGLTLALLLTAPWWLRELRRGGKYREGLPERLGRVPRGRLLPDRLQPDRTMEPWHGAIWVHAVSVGEVLAVAPLVAGLRAARPHTRVFISSTTRTGQAIARARFGSKSVFYFPADFAFAVRAWLRFLRPSLVVLVESEFWPRFLFEAHRARIPVAVVNARVSSRSWPRYRRLRALWRPLLGTLALVHAQSAEDAQRLETLGALHVEVGGNLKYDLQPPRPTPLLQLLQGALPSGLPVLVCGSTLAGEEALLLRMIPAGTVLLLAPRHPERFDEVAALLARGTRAWFRLSAWRNFPEAIAGGSVLLLDSVGELAALYRLATVAIVGGGFLHGGGHNPLEPAALGKPVVVGTGYANFVEIVETLATARAVAVASAEELAATIEDLLLHPEEAMALGERARQVCMERGGATARALAGLLRVLESERKA